MVAVGFAGCNGFGDKSKEDEMIVLREMNRSLENASELSESTIKFYFSLFEDRMNDPNSAQKAAIWYPKAEKVTKLTNELAQYIDSLKISLKNFHRSSKDSTSFNEIDMISVRQLFLDGGHGNKLFNKLGEYKTNILNVDPSIRQLNVDFTLHFPIEKRDENFGQKWVIKHFYKTSALITLTELTRFKNDIFIINAEIVRFLYLKAPVNFCGWDQFHSLIETNTQILKPGQEFTITAGIGSFSRSARPNITIDGSPIKVNMEGVAEYKFIVGKPGKYSKMVRIDYSEINGTKKSFEKVVNFQVADCPK